MQNAAALLFQEIAPIIAYALKLPNPLVWITDAVAVGITDFLEIQLHWRKKLF